MNLEMAIQQFNGLTYPNLQQEAQRKRFYEPLIAVVAQHNGQNIGMALAEYRRPDNPGALLRSLFVAPAHREKGIAKSMMQHLEQALKKIGISTLDWIYRTDWTSLAIIEKFMLTNDWLPAQSTLHQYRLNAKKLLATEAFKQPKLADGYSIFSWAQLTASQRAEIIAKAEYPANLDPFQIESLQAENSYGLKKNEKVIGWMITHRSNAETIQYTSLFLSNSERKQFNTIPKKVMPLIKAAVYHQATQNIPLIIFQVEAKNQEMQKFTARFLAPAIVKSSEVRITQKRVR